MKFDKFEEVTGKKLHFQITRELAYFDDYIKKILQCYENDEIFYLVALYTPTRSSLNLNDINQFLLMKWLQSVFNVPLIIHVNDNHRFLKDNINVNEFPDLNLVKEIVLNNCSQFINLKPEELSKLSGKQISKLICNQQGNIKEDFKMKFTEIIAINCMKEIISIGFDIKNTFICRNLEYIGQQSAYYENIITLGARITLSQSLSCYSGNYSDDVQTISLASKDMAALFPCSYPEIFQNQKNIRGLVINLDEKKIHMSRRLAYEMNWPKLALFQLVNLPSLHGNGNMDSFGVNSAIFFNDNEKNVKKKIDKFAFSGGKDTIEEHERLGGNCAVDISYQYLRYFMEDEERLGEIRKLYETGKLLTGELKKEAANLISNVLGKLQERFRGVSDDELKAFTAVRKLSFGNMRNFGAYIQEEPETEVEELEIEGLEIVEDKAEEEGDVVTPWEVQGDIDKGIDYDKLVEKYGSSKLERELVDRFESITGEKAHHLLRRGMFYSHREFNEILDSHRKRERFYLYTGRGPSSDALHLGHMTPFIFTKWLQDVFDVPLIIQLTDDEKCLMRNISIDDVTRMAIENVKDIIAVGFDINKTFIFRDLQYISQESAFYKTALRIGSKVNFNSMRAIFGFNEKDSIEKIAFPPVQAATSFSSSFPAIFGLDHRIRSLIPCAIDQDPYFRMTRDVAPRLNMPKPALILSRFFPSLQGNQTKMNASDPRSAIFMTDTAEIIADKINNYAFTIPEERKKTLSIDEIAQYDICYQYLTFFMEDQEKLDRIREGLADGTVTNELLKKELISVLIPIVEAHQARKSKITDEMIKEFMTPRPIK